MERVQHERGDDRQADHPRTILLASRSPRRLELARGRGWHVKVIPPAEAVEQDAPPRRATETVGDYAERLALAKAWAVARACGPGTLLACDTLAELDGEPLGKPADRDDARRILRRLAGRVHRVVSGVCVWHRPDLQPLSGQAESILEMGPLPDDLLEWYLDSGLWQGKAGACGFQDERLPLRLLSGSPSNVVGLPLELLDDLLSVIDRALSH
jgi:septum formation protein